MAGASARFLRMTAVAAVRVAGEPPMVGDVVLTSLGERSEGGYAGKPYLRKRRQPLGPEAGKFPCK
jgi:hypothetical protein